MPELRQNVNLATLLLVGLLAAFAGCGGASYAPAPAPTPVTPNVAVSGQYNLVLTSSSQATTNIYTDFTPTGSAFIGAGNTLVCPSNDLSQCRGGDAPGVPIVPSGTMIGTNVTIVISFPVATGSDTVTMKGSATTTVMSGTYTDTLGDSGTWTASSSLHPFSPTQGAYNYTGTFNSTVNPLPIAPSLSAQLQRDPSAQSTFNIAGQAAITNLPCLSSLTLAGHAIGDALSLTDAASKVSIVALPGAPNIGNFVFTYKFEQDAPSCSGDSGRGTLTINLGGWDY